jgi:hypothetical protein
MLLPLVQGRVSVPLVQAQELVPEPWDAWSELEGPLPYTLGLIPTYASRLVFSPTPAVNSADVDDEAMAAIGQRVVAEAPCVALEVVAEEQVFEAIDRIPVVPIARKWHYTPKL